MVVLWLLGLSVMLLMLAGLSVDLWQAFSERRALAGAADAAAYAGASGLDEQAFRATGVVALEPGRAEALALDSLLRQTDVAALTGPPKIEVAPGRITVTLHGRVELTLLRLLAPAVDALDLSVSSVAEPQLGG